MANLYDIDERLLMLLEHSIDNETGEMLEGDELDRLLDEVQMDLNDKIENTILLTKNLDSDAEAIKNEEKRLQARRIQIENQSENLKKRINYYILAKHTNEYGDVDLSELNKYKFETPRVQISYRKSEIVDVDEINKVDKQFIKTTVEHRVDKPLLKKFLKENTVDWARIKTNMNMQIK